MKLLLFSNSTNAGEEYFTYPLPHIKEFLSGLPVEKIVFVPFAAVTFSYDDYEEKVNAKLATIGLHAKGIHRFNDRANAIASADVIMVGGGNTFHLLKECYQYNILQPIREAVKKRTPYIGWSAGSNLACPTICTTNDMPIVQPPSFEALGLIPFQINPHYLDANPDGHAGETREQRIMEFLAANPSKTVVGLREGCWLTVEGSRIVLNGAKSARIFKYKHEPVEHPVGKELVL